MTVSDSFSRDLKRSLRFSSGTRSATEAVDKRVSTESLSDSDGIEEDPRWKSINQLYPYQSAIPTKTIPIILIIFFIPVFSILQIPV